MRESAHAYGVAALRLKQTGSIVALEGGDLDVLVAVEVLRALDEFCLLHPPPLVDLAQPFEVALFFRSGLS